MVSGSPRQWTLTIGSSPGPLPHVAWWMGLGSMATLVAPSGHVPEADALLEWLGGHTIGEAGETVDATLAGHGAAPLVERTPVLMLGELGNPNRLADIMLDRVPFWPARLDALARIWTDRMDARDVQPGVHHVTLGRTSGWWELTQIAWLDRDQARLCVRWLSDRSTGSWRAVRLGEGEVSLHVGDQLLPPPLDALLWDGTSERIEADAPERTGPLLDRDAVVALVHTRVGAYDHRGRLARCVHHDQRTFHDELYRRGSAHRWDDILSGSTLTV